MNINKFLKTTIFLSLLSLCLYTKATSTSQSIQNIWQIKPKVCLVEQLGQACEISLNVNINRQLVLTNKTKLKGLEYCLFLDQEKITCFTLVDENEDASNTVNNPIYTLRLLPSDKPPKIDEQIMIRETSNGLSLNLIINNQSQLTLQDAKANIVYRHPLSIKARKAGKKTRRVREPWSLF